MGNKGINPSSALLRAVIINGAVALTGTYGSKGDALEPPPNHVQGYGRMQLTSSIVVPAQTVTGGVWAGSSLKLVVLDEYSQPTTSTTAAARVANGKVCHMLLAVKA